MLSLEGGIINYSSGANTSGNFSIGTIASFACTETGDGLNGTVNTICMLPSGLANGIGIWSNVTPSCDREFLLCDSECMHAVQNYRVTCTECSLNSSLLPRKVIYYVHNYMQP